MNTGDPIAPAHSGTSADATTAALAVLRERFGANLSTNASVREQHGADESYHRAQPPDAVLFAQSTEDVVDAVKICAAAELPIIPWGAGTSLEGHVQASLGGVTIDLSRMDQVLRISDEDFTARVQAGVRRKQLNAALRHSGLHFSVDPGADATLGGMAATRASGTTAVRYGTMRQNVLNVTAVLADGAVIRTAQNAPKTSAGYDLTGLFVGSEGTLGIMTELTVRLHPLPEAVGAFVCRFRNADDAVAAVTRAMQARVDLARIEFLDDQTMAAINAYERAAYPVAFTLFLEFHGSTRQVDEQVSLFKELAGDLILGEPDIAFRQEDRDRLWRARHNALYATKALAPGLQCLITDVCVPVSRLVECLRETRIDLGTSRLMSTIFGHVGDGNFHAAILVDPTSAEDIAEAERLHERMARRAIQLEGTCTGEHGIGLGKRHLLLEELGDAVCAMHAVKRALDPRGVLNPGKLFL